MTRGGLKILMVAAECAPLAKVGGLADVVGALPKALLALGAEIKIILPLYGLIDQKKFPVRKLRDPVKVEIGSGMENFSLWEYTENKTGLIILLIQHRYFNNKEIYRYGRIGTAKKYSRGAEDVKRFALFSLAALAATKSLGWRPNIIHCHDWHTALIPDYLKTIYKNDPFFKKTKTLYTIHNLANQGMVGPEIVGYTKLDPSLPIIKVDLKNGDVNFMVQGILGADLINTVSPTYAKEILTHYEGAGLEKILRLRRTKLSGIINGIDTADFDPKTDPLIESNYDIKTLSFKKNNKIKLQSGLGWKPDKELVLVGLVSRLVWQKGFDLITEKLAELPCQFVILGSGQPGIENNLLNLAKKYPDKFFVKIGFDLKLAKMIYAGSDFFLMPSRFEPCGLSQLVAMRYGTVPIVRKTGGLSDTVTPKTGFLFKHYSRESLEKVLKLALDTYYKKPDKWLKLQRSCLKQDFSWSKSAKDYLKLYNKLIKG